MIATMGNVNCVNQLQIDDVSNTLHKIRLLKF